MLTRRQFATSLLASPAATAISRAARAETPNILCISCEDIGPHLGCYGDAYSVTPNLDRLAAKGQRYNYAWSNAPVCAPARTTIISGMYPTSNGSEHMRSKTRLPHDMKMFPQYLREAGYYVSNNAKEDYNLEKPGQVWDDSSKQAHWRDRHSGQPFFSVFNLEITHESQLRTRPRTGSHDPAKVRVPAYHPDTREVREDWARYYDNITTMDGQAAMLFADLEADGLADSTVVFFWGDHGSGMPRSKRFPYNSGLQVPLLIHVPDRYRAHAGAEYKAGGASQRLVSFVDFAPTVLSLAGVEAPKHFQGSAFLGPLTRPAPEYLHGFRGRMDERYDMMRSVRDRKYVYIRNYMPHRAYGAKIDYMFETATTKVWKKLYDEGTLAPPQTYFWENKPVEELYDLEADPDEVRNLAPMEEHRETLDRLFQEQQRHAAAIRDAGYLPESEMHRRSAGATPYEMGHDDKRYPLAAVMAAAEQAAARCSWEPDFANPDPAIRYWMAVGCAVRAMAAPIAMLKDTSPEVRIAAAESIARFGGDADLAAALELLGRYADPKNANAMVALLALQSIDAIGKKALPIREKLVVPPPRPPTTAPDFERYVGDLARQILANLTPTEHATLGDTDRAPRRDRKVARGPVARDPVAGGLAKGRASM